MDATRKKYLRKVSQKKIIIRLARKPIQKKRAKAQVIKATPSSPYRQQNSKPSRKRVSIWKLLKFIVFGKQKKSSPQPQHKFTSQPKKGELVQLILNRNPNLSDFNSKLQDIIKDKYPDAQFTLEPSEDFSDGLQLKVRVTEYSDDFAYQLYMLHAKVQGVFDYALKFDVYSDYEELVR